MLSYVDFKCKFKIYLSSNVTVWSVIEIEKIWITIIKVSSIVFCLTKVGLSLKNVCLKHCFTTKIF